MMKKILTLSIFAVTQIFASTYYYSDHTSDASDVTFDNDIAYVKVYDGCSNSTPTISVSALVNRAGVAVPFTTPTGWNGAYTGNTNNVDYAFFVTPGGIDVSYANSTDCNNALPTSYSSAVSFINIAAQDYMPGFSFAAAFDAFDVAVSCPDGETYDSNTQTCVTASVDSNTTAEQPVCAADDTSSFGAVYDASITGYKVDSVCRFFDYVCPNGNKPVANENGQYTCNTIDCSKFVPSEKLYGYYSYVNYIEDDSSYAKMISSDECNNYVDKVYRDKKIKSVAYFAPVASCPDAKFCYYLVDEDYFKECDLNSVINSYYDSTGYKYYALGNRSEEDCKNVSELNNFEAYKYLDVHAYYGCTNISNLCFVKEKNILEKTVKDNTTTITKKNDDNSTEEITIEEYYDKDTKEKVVKETKKITNADGSTQNIVTVTRKSYDENTGKVTETKDTTTTTTDPSGNSTTTTNSEQTTRDSSDDEIGDAIEQEEEDKVKSDLSSYTGEMLKYVDDSNASDYIESAVNTYIDSMSIKYKLFEYMTDFLDNFDLGVLDIAAELKKTTPATCPTLSYTFVTLGRQETLVVLNQESFNSDRALGKAREILAPLFLLLSTVSAFFLYFKIAFKH